ncbi:hypothetical protein ACQKGA_29840 [Priestia megaterium]|uniref:hypothetical protein n=1 Tax=Priestia megaterium TaxID=1404 RepID=UPI003D01CD91
MLETLVIQIVVELVEQLDSSAALVDLMLGLFEHLVENFIAEPLFAYSVDCF